MKHILIDQGRPNLNKVPKDIPPEVHFYFILFYFILAGQDYGLMLEHRSGIETNFLRNFA